MPQRRDLRARKTDGSRSSPHGEDDGCLVVLEFLLGTGWWTVGTAVASGARRGRSSGCENDDLTSQELHMHVDEINMNKKNRGMVSRIHLFMVVGVVAISGTTARNFVCPKEQRWGVVRWSGGECSALLL